jgi:hypothetical protein
MSGKLEEMGLEDYLNATKGLHNGNGFKEFERMVTKEPPENRSLIAEKFSVTRPTVYEWIKLFDKMGVKEKK